MNRLTGKDAQLMMEALANVYEKKGDCVDKDKKTKHNCAKKVCSEQWGEGTCVPEHHTLLEDGTVTHYDVVFEHGLERMVPVEELEVLVTEMHEHAAMEGEELQENQAANRARQRELRQKQNAGRAEQQFGALKPKPRPAGSFRDRIFSRRSASPAAQANTNRYGQNIKVGSPTGPAQNDQLKKPTATGTAPAAPTSMANKAPANPNVTSDGTKFERRLPTSAELRAAQQARKDAPKVLSRGEIENRAVKAAVGVSKGTVKDPKIAADAARKAELERIRSRASSQTQAGVRPTVSSTADPKTPPAVPAAKPTAAAGPGGYQVSAAATPKTSPAPVVKKKPAMGARNRMRMEELDIFDTIKEYLIGEGATEEEALKQMLTLTDEQRTEIIEGSCGSKKKKKSRKGGY